MECCICDRCYAFESGFSTLQVRWRRNSLGPVSAFSSATIQLALEVQKGYSAREDALHGRLGLKKMRRQLQDFRMIQSITPAIVPGRAVRE